VTSSDVIFFLNLMAALPGTWAAYVPPLEDGTPLALSDLTASISTPDEHTVVLHLHRPVNPRWFTMNELSQITPLPREWDRIGVTSSGTSTPPFVVGGNLATRAGGCWGSQWIGDGNRGPGRNADQTQYPVDSHGMSTVVTDRFAARARRCSAVYSTLVAFAQDRSHYADVATDTGRLWSTVSGPWRLREYSPTYHTASFQRRADQPLNGGPQFVEYTSCPHGCVNDALKGRLDMLPVGTDVVGRPNDLKDLSQLQRRDFSAAGFELRSNLSHSVNFAAINFRSRNGADRHAHAVFAQRYIRRALQFGIDQSRIIRRQFQGLGVGARSPLPATSTAVRTPPLRRERARALLESHGWRVRDGIASCQSPGTGAHECGANIPANTPLEFDFLCVDDAGGGRSIVREIVRGWRRIGVRAVISTASFNDVISATFRRSPTWDFAYWGGWLYAPDYLATGEALFATGSSSNAGGYTSATSDRLILDTIQSTKPGAMQKYSDWVGRDIPVLWLPQPITLYEVRRTAKVPVSRLDEFTPELWRR
jgi:peptide/nickel transport system substrate-binding protein